MKKVLLLSVLSASILSAMLAFAATQPDAQAGPPDQKTILQRYGFIDENGDGINDLARDSDNDGIPNCLDPDWVRPQDGTGLKNKYGHKNQWAHVQNRGAASHFNHSHNYLWNHNLNNGNTLDFCDQKGSNDSPGRKRRPNRKN